MPLDLTAYSDREVLLALGETQPDFVDLIVRLIDAGRADEEIVRLAAAADGSAQAMHYTAKVCRALRALAREKALDELTAESERLGLY